MTQLPAYEQLPAAQGVARQKKALRAAGLVLAAGVLLTGLLGWNVWRNARTALEQQFALAANERVDRVRERLLLQRSELESIQRFFENSNEVSREEFEHFVSPLLGDALGYAWLPRIEHGGRAVFEAQVQASGMLDYQLHELGPQGDPVPAQVRERYFPVLYGASEYLQELPLGLDLGSTLPGRELTQRVLIGRQLTASMPVVLPGAPVADAAGVLLAAPFYRGGVTTAAGEEGRGGLLGILVAAISYRLLIEQGMDADSLAQLALTLRDSAEEQPDPPMYRSAVMAAPDSGLVAERHLDFAGRDYLVRIEPSRDFLQRNEGHPQLWVVLGGLLTSLLLAGYVLALLGQRQRALQLVAERTAELRANQLELQENQARLHFAMDSAGHGVWDWNLDLGKVFYSHAWKAMLGFRAAEIGASPDECARRVHPDDRTARSEALQRHLCGETSLYQSEHRLRCKSGRWLWVLDRGQVVERSGEGSPRRMIGTQTDISSRKAVELELGEVNNRLHGLLDAATQVAIVSTDLRGFVRSCNVGAERLFGYSAREVLGRPVPENIFVKEEILRRAHDLSIALGREIRGFEVVGALVGEGHEEHEWTCVRRDGRQLKINLIITGVRDSSGVLTGYLGIATDITRRKEAELELRRLSVTDALTGVHNRRYFKEQLELSMARCSRSGEPLALVMFDVDHFKDINDRFGHEAGDTVLITLCQRVSQRLRKVDVFCRLGGEELVVLCPGSSVEQAAQLAEALWQALRSQPVEGVGVVTASFGVVGWRLGETADDLLRKVDRAVYRAKRSGRDRLERDDG
ncbi:PAS/PAC sensor-containing diguanylate cyclase [Pseudomonas sp. ATCC 13867]|uniref:sensor domain-containing diguanylate cyclase n=1 Tax=Pseudomonas sp. ATCC 13867 TaxID=1294143 RepID=UPI0002C4E304|nr:diguanylate cyclase [Pseudomonas sp. ATCC 13867]AGI25157.1 PAS/PAC sensor-containing diguanylate cyclase [Pseudomonas sp. ATCC 13867]RFQ34959.1 GGDEF domain-containing protein [Pseudomonas sp. ATCC 13867]